MDTDTLPPLDAADQRLLAFSAVMDLAGENVALIKAVAAYGAAVRAEARPETPPAAPSSLDWTPIPGAAQAHARTAVAWLTVALDTERLAAHRYTGRIATLNGNVLARTTGLASLEDAQEWCETRYAALLRDELARLEG